MVRLENHGVSIGDGTLAVIAGLNVLEDVGLAHEVATELKAICIDLDLPYVFKASYDKANRSSITSYRGPGLEAGGAILREVKDKHDIALATDVHTPEEAVFVADFVDLVQIPAFLVRQTDLIVSASCAVAARGGILHIKKAQFLAPWDCINIITKARAAAAAVQIVLCERGTSFGYNNLVVDMLAISEMQRLGVPVSIDATHAVQLPGTAGGGGENIVGTVTGGRRSGVPIIARAAVAAGADAVFFEFHPTPNTALCDAASCLPLADARALLTELKALYMLVHH